MTIQFDLPELYSKNLADDGVWFEVYDQRDRLWGKFKIKHYDQHSRKGKLLMEAAYKNQKTMRRGKVDAEAIQHYCLLNGLLIDWSDIKANGKDVDYSKANADAYFKNPHTAWIMSYLLNQCENAEHYGEDDAEEVVKN